MCIRDCSGMRGCSLRTRGTACGWVGFSNNRKRVAGEDAWVRLAAQTSIVHNLDQLLSLKHQLITATCSLGSTSSNLPLTCTAFGSGSRSSTRSAGLPSAGLTNPHAVWCLQAAEQQQHPALLALAHVQLPWWQQMPGAVLYGQLGCLLPDQHQTDVYELSLCVCGPCPSC